MPRLSVRILLLLLFVMPLGCASPRAASDEGTCDTLDACTKLYRASLSRLQACLAERRRAGYVGPGGAVPPECDGIRAENERWAHSVNRFHADKQVGGGEGQGEGFVVPPLPAASSAPDRLAPGSAPSP
jgi:hypothetical protein